jgi:pimeloyl-ACP methyl ester carboxylesterase
VARWIVALIVASAAMVGCGGHHSAAQGRHQSTTPRALPLVSGPGRLVDIGGGRSLYLYCVGSGSPTIVLEAGFGGNSGAWRAVQPQLGRTTRTCAYDRAGLGSSLPMPGVHDAADEIRDLERLLDHARLPPPYVLVGHSYGGLLVRLFAKAHPDETAGVVLVDSMGRNQDQRLLPIWRAQPRRVRRRVPKPTGKPVEDGVNILAGEALAAGVTSLGDTPLAVISRGQTDETTGDLPPNVRRAADHLWTRMQDELTALSPDHLHVVALRSGHLVPIEQPDVVVRATQAVVRAARAHARLPACRDVFDGARARCLG